MYVFGQLGINVAFQVLLEERERDMLAPEVAGGGIELTGWQRQTCETDS